MGFNKRKWWYFGKDYRKRVSIEIAGWHSTPHIILQADGDEGDIMFSLACGFAIYVTFAGFIPRSWYPTYESRYSQSRIPESREFSLKIHGGIFWWNFWVSEEWASYSRNKTWRMGTFHFVDLIKGKHDYNKVEASRQQFILPFLEGIYNVEVIKWDRKDSWQRWPTRKMVTWEVRAGYYDGPPNPCNWKDKGVPVEGKGENSWDCDEDATYSISFPGHPYRKDLRIPYDAALYFWHSMMKSRERYGSAKWTPKDFEGKKLQIIR